MDITIICVGKLKENYWKDASAEYIKRLRPYASVDVVELKESRMDDPDEEGSSIISVLGDRSGQKKRFDYVVTLEIKGKGFSSEDLAKKINELGIDGISNIAFVIGGSNGLSEDVSARADLKLSFSAMTFPHQMMRVILLEQIYRSFKIIRGETYHK